jgi:dTDP-4-amino-4,6-dideoxygalactose transaminase
MIKFFDLYKNDKKLHPKILKNINKTLKKGDYILGEATSLFEKKFSNYVNSRYAVSCGNGTDALILALKSLNLPKNSEVILPAMTYCSTIFSVIHSNLKPVLVDIEKNSPLINIQKIHQKITNKTKVILPVHLYGSAVNITLIKKVINKFKQKIFIIDDCAQAHGAFDDNLKKIGSTSDISCFSLYPGKNLGAYGDAGIITTNNRKFFLKIKNIRNLGSDKKYIHTNVGLNSRLDTIQAIVLNEKITKLNNSNNKRKIIAKSYNNNINNNKIIKIKYSKNAVYHQYVIMTKYRPKLINHLTKNKVQFGFHYPYALHQLDCFKKDYINKNYQNSEDLAKMGLSLPIDPTLTKKEIKFIIKTLNNF